jgi:hypothetical protein
MQTPLQTFASKLCATLGLSRGLRVDERNLPKIVSVDSVGLIKRAQPGFGSTVVFYGGPALLQEGLELALRTMGIGQSGHEGDPDA